MNTNDWQLKFGLFSIEGSAQTQKHSLFILALLENVELNRWCLHIVLGLVDIAEINIALLLLTTK